MSPNPVIASADGQPSRYWYHRPASAQTSAWPLPAMDEGVWLHYNLSGDAHFAGADGAAHLIPAGAVVWIPASGRVDARRCGGDEVHQCLSFHLPATWLDQLLPQGAEAAVQPALRRLLHGSEKESPIYLRSMRFHEQAWAQEQGRQKPGEDQRVLANARLLELCTTELYGGQHRESQRSVQGRDRIEKAKVILQQHLSNPPSLATLAVMVGCTPTSLSRSFRRVNGTTLTQWLVVQRLEAATRLMTTGECNVSEAALEVGYQSVSHFSRCFVRHYGMPPSHYVKQITAPSNVPEDPFHSS